MPKIQAPTVVEHHALQNRALLDAARSLLAEPGRTEPPGLGEVASRAGLARSSIYQYFASRDEMFAAVVADLFPAWAARVEGEMACATTPQAKVLAYIHSNLALVAKGEHAVIRGLAATAPASLQQTSATLHDTLRTPLVQALTDAGEPDPDAMATLIHALVLKTSTLIETGAQPDEARDLLGRLGEILRPNQTRINSQRL